MWRRTPIYSAERSRPRAQACWLTVSADPKATDRLFDRAVRARTPAGGAGRAELDYAENDPDGRRLGVIRTVDGNGDIWLLDTSRGVPTRFTSEQGDRRLPDLGPGCDSPRLPREPQRSDRVVRSAEQRRCRRNGRSSQILAMRFPMTGSPDGREILFSRDWQDRVHIWSVGGDRHSNRSARRPNTFR